MGRKPTDYSKTIIYKIKCNDESVLDFYVGSTTNFSKRKNCHKGRCENSKVKLYEMIRANGGWKNWTMVEVEVYPCNSSTETRIREEYWRETLQASLNQIRAYLSEEARVERDKQYLQENPEKNAIKCKKYYQKHADEQKAKHKQYYQEHADKIKTKISQYRQEHADDIKSKKAQKFECDCGGKYTHNHRARHERTKTHQNWEKTNKNIFSQSINEC
jgi:hypothetical protein